MLLSFNHVAACLCTCCKPLIATLNCVHCNICGHAFLVHLQTSGLTCPAMYFLTALHLQSCSTFAVLLSRHAKHVHHKLMLFFRVMMRLYGLLRWRATDFSQRQQTRPFVYGTSAPDAVSKSSRIMQDLCCPWLLRATSSFPGHTTTPSKSGTCKPFRESQP